MRSRALEAMRELERASERLRLDVRDMQSADLAGGGAARSAAVSAEGQRQEEREGAISLSVTVDTILLATDMVRWWGGVSGARV
jgi:hypothetical protein